MSFRVFEPMQYVRGKTPMEGVTLNKAGNLAIGQGPQRGLNWKNGQRVDLLMGSGADANRVCLRANANGGGYKLCNDAKPGQAQALHFNSSHMRRAFPRGAKSATWTIADDALYITLVPNETPPAA